MKYEPKTAERIPDEMEEYEAKARGITIEEYREWAEKCAEENDKIFANRDPDLDSNSEMSMYITTYVDALIRYSSRRIGWVLGPQPIAMHNFHRKHLFILLPHGCTLLRLFRQAITTPPGPEPIHRLHGTTSSISYFAA